MGIVVYLTSVTIAFRAASEPRVGLGALRVCVCVCVWGVLGLLGQWANVLGNVGISGEELNKSLSP